MSAPGSLVWFAQHESRLAWRDMLSMMTAGRRDRERKVAAGIVGFAVFMHVVAFLALGRAGKVGFSPDLPTLISITSGALLSGSAMLSQAMESVTRTFYTRSDLELILSSPVRAGRLFAVRIGAMAFSVSLMALLIIGPFIDVLAWRGGARWLGAYGVIIAVSLIATALAVVLTVLLFQTIGPKRTRLVAQIVAAVIGGIFVIGLQMAAMFSTGTMSRLAFLRSKYVVARPRRDWRHSSFDRGRCCEPSRIFRHNGDLRPPLLQLCRRGLERFARRRAPSHERPHLPRPGGIFHTAPQGAAPPHAGPVADVAIVDAIAVSSSAHGAFVEKLRVRGRSRDHPRAGADHGRGSAGGRPGVADDLGRRRTGPRRDGADFVRAHSAGEN